MDWTNAKRYLMIIVIASFALVLISFFVPASRPELTGPALNIAEADVSFGHPILSFNGFVSKKGENYIYVRVGDRQEIPAGALRNVLVARETKIQKITPGETDKTGYVVSSKINNISFNQVPLGARVIVTSKNSTDISKEAVFEAESIAIIEGEF